MEYNVFINNSWENTLPDLPNECFDLIYTDPPYGMNYCSMIPGCKTWNKSGASDSRFEKPIMNDHEGGLDWEEFAKQCYRLLKNNKFMFLHCNLEIIYTYLINFKKAGFDIKGQATWNKKSAIGGDLKSSMKRDAEPIIYMVKGKPAFNPIFVERKGEKVERNRISEIADWEFVIPKSEKVGFPTQKPLELCSQVIHLATDPNDAVLDPFAGSATIALAAKMAGRRYFTVELDKEIYDKFNIRLELCR